MNKRALSSLLAIAAILGGCNSKNLSKIDSTADVLSAENRVTMGEEKSIGNEDVKFEIAPLSNFQNATTFDLQNEGSVSVPVATKPQSLVLGYPMSLLGKESIFGGVITKVSNYKNTGLGGLKLSDLPAIHVTSTLVQQGGKAGLVLKGCVQACTANSKDQPLINLPVVNVDSVNKMIYVDLSAVGKELNIVGLLGAESYFKLKHVDSNTVMFDFTKDTLVFDVESEYEITGTLVDKEASEEDQKTATETESVITARFYLKVNPKFNPKFQSRTPVDNVGFFTTDRSQTTYITRFDANPTKRPKYYIKNVPVEYVGSFKKAFDSWNVEFKKSLGYEIFDYEVVAENDPRGDLLVPGDIRYNIIEWDLKNQASYGGLGPSIPNQYTGETISGNVLVQGPKIVELYKEWFGLSQQINNLIAQGEIKSAEALELEFKRKLSATEPLKVVKHKINLGPAYFRIPSEDPAYEDAESSKHEFEIIPAGYTYEQYMDGYFQELVAHELGHNIGLRHNFRGNLLSDDSMTEGSVSGSIMEYLGRGFRHLNRISKYDTMAILYGYKGEAATKSGWFCTDENVPSPFMPMGSPECSRDDATSDPFSYLQGRLERIMSLLVAKDSVDAPDWTRKDVQKEFDSAVNGMALYAVTAPLSATKWTNFFNKLDRPANTGADAQAYVLDKLADVVCDQALDAAVNAKATAEAKAVAAKNLLEARTAFSNMVKKLNVLDAVFTKAAIPCLIE